jgi:hypothetical protein
LPILLGDSKNLQEGFTPKQRCYENCKPKITKIGEARTQFAIILQDSKNLGEGLAWNASKLKMAVSNQRNIDEI